MNKNKEIDLMRDKIIIALLESASLTEAAQRAGVSRKTLYNRINCDAQIADAYKQQQDLYRIEHIEVIETERQHAKDVIRTIMDDEEQPASLRLKAAMRLLDMSETALDKVERLMLSNVTKHHCMTTGQTPSDNIKYDPSDTP